MHLFISSWPFCFEGKSPTGDEETQREMMLGLICIARDWAMMFFPCARPQLSLLCFAELRFGACLSFDLSQEPFYDEYCDAWNTIRRYKEITAKMSLSVAIQFQLFVQKPSMKLVSLSLFLHPRLVILPRIHE